MKQNKQQKKDKFKLNSSVFIQTFNLTDITQSNSLLKKLIPTLALVNKSWQFYLISIKISVMFQALSRLKRKNRKSSYFIEPQTPWAMRVMTREWKFFFPQHRFAAGWPKNLPNCWIPFLCIQSSCNLSPLEKKEALAFAYLQKILERA